MKLIAIRVLTVVALMISLCSAALGCSCGGGSGPACQEATGVDAIFVGRVVKKDIIRSGTAVRVTFDLAENFRGVSGKSTEIVTAAGEAACGFSFAVGKRYLVFAGKQEGNLWVSLCSATKPAKYATEDIAYLRSLPTLPETARIYGTLKRYTFDRNFKPKFQPTIMDHYRPPEDDYMALAPMGGTQIRVHAVDGEHEATVDPTGDWSVGSVPAGPYEISVELPPNMLLFPAMGMRGEIQPRGYALVDLRTAINRQVRGHIDSGVPLSQYYLAQVGLFRADDTEIDLIRPFREVFPDRETGNYEFKALPPDRYFVAVLLDEHASSDAAVFYPGVDDLEKAKILTLGKGESLSNIDFHITAPMFRDRPSCCKFIVRVPKTH